MHTDAATLAGVGVGTRRVCAEISSGVAKRETSSAFWQSQKSSHRMTSQTAAEKSKRFFNARLRRERRRRPTKRFAMFPFPETRENRNVASGNASDSYRSDECRKKHDNHDFLAEFKRETYRLHQEWRFSNFDEIKTLFLSQQLLTFHA